MERHCVRVFRLAQLAAHGRPVDREVLLCAALLHDVGAYGEQRRSTDSYVTAGRHRADELLAPLGWEPQRLRRCLDAIELHHHVRRQWKRGVEVEVIRRADLMDITRGRVRFGVSRQDTGHVLRDVPRNGFGRELGRLIFHLVRVRPLELLRISTVRPTGVRQVRP
jgi:hypothetical protein